MTPTKWEYWIDGVGIGAMERRPPTAGQLWLQRLNELGDQGWELVVERRDMHADSWYEGTFKRPKA
jgi:hypothetical protein